MGKLKYSFTHC